MFEEGLYASADDSLQPSRGRQTFQLFTIFRRSKQYKFKALAAKGKVGTSLLRLVLVVPCSLVWHRAGSFDEIEEVFERPFHTMTVRVCNYTKLPSAPKMGTRVSAVSKSC